MKGISNPMHPIISIIIPVYNVEQYLRQCLDSCINQTFKRIEIIVVNDASPDNCDLIMKEYEKNYPELIKCIYLKKNIRQGGARNRGLDIALGEYVTFVDSDDWIDPEMCEKLYASAIVNDADMVIANGLAIDNDVKKVYKLHDCKSNEYNVKIDSLLGSNKSIAPWARLYKKELITKSGFQFSINQYYEDRSIVGIWILSSNITNVISESLYFYRIRIGSVTNTKTRENEYESLNPLIDFLYKAELINEIDNIHVWDFVLDRIYASIIKLILLYRLDNDKWMNIFKDKILKFVSNISEYIDCLKIDPEGKSILRRFFEQNDFFRAIHNKHINISDFAVWGYGTYGKIFLKYLYDEKQYPNAIIDTNPSMQKENCKFFNLPIIAFKDYKNECGTIIVAVKDFNSFRDIKKQITNYNSNIKIKYFTEFL